MVPRLMSTHSRTTYSALHRVWVGWRIQIKRTILLKYLNKRIELLLFKDIFILLFNE
jgi:hypothetical protein